MQYNIRIVSTYPPRRCGIGTFSRDLATALEHFTAEIGNIRIAAINNGSGRYDIPVDLIIDQYNPVSWRDTITNIIARAKESSNPTVVLLQQAWIPTTTARTGGARISSKWLRPSRQAA